MARVDFTTPRLCLDRDLSEGETATLAANEANYLVNVLRLRPGARVLAFNGRDGEFAATIAAATRKATTLAIGERIRPQEWPPDVDYLFAPLEARAARLHGAEGGRDGRAPPAAGRHPPHPGEPRSISPASPPTRARRRSNAASSGCRRSRPSASWTKLSPNGRPNGCSSSATRRRRSPIRSPRMAGVEAEAGVSLLIGPEGGFEDSERRAIAALPRVLRLNLGPRILRADTAAVAALTLI